MIAPERRPEFKVFFVDSDYSAGETHASSLRALGYDTSVFPTSDSALMAAKNAPPHAVVFNYASLEVVADDFLSGLSEISAETLAILLCAPQQLQSAVQYVGRGLAYDHLEIPIRSALELAQTVDRACSALYLKFENEQLREGREAPDRPAGGPAFAAGAFAELNDFYRDLETGHDAESIVQKFLEAISRRFGGAPALYFKHLPQHLALAVTQSAGLPIEKVRGIGFDLKSLDGENLRNAFVDAQNLAPLKALLRQAFRLERYLAFAHAVENEVAGAFVVFAEPTAEPANEALIAMRLAFDSAYRRCRAVVERHLLDVYDGATGLLNRRSFSNEIEKEIVRARRISQPVSLLCVRLDGELDDRARADASIRVIAAILKKTARVNDFVGRTGPAELMLLLPHTDAMGAAVKGERARKAVETVKFAPLDESGPPTISVGVSEYPAISSDAESLVRTADEALDQVRRAGGNKVCLGSPPSGFSPDFAPGAGSGLTSSPGAKSEGAAP